MEIAKAIRKISKKEAFESYQELVDFPYEKQIPTSRQGLKALDYLFFRFRLAAKTKRHISFLNALKDKKTHAYIKAKTRKIKKYDLFTRKTPDEELRNQYSTFQLYYGTINQFRPVVAKWLYSQLEPKIGILDISAGWGGRCIAAMALGIPYIGIDANKRLESPYKKMIKNYPHTSSVTMVFKPSETVNFSKYSYDLVFTSPPYFMLEEYQGMPAYEQKQGFLDDFFVPVLQNSWKHLATNGHFALNMPDEMYDSVKKCFPPIHKKYKMPLSDRHAVEAAQGKDIKGTTDRFEYIYVWKKTPGLTVDSQRKGCGVV